MISWIRNPSPVDQTYIFSLRFRVRAFIRVRIYAIRIAMKGKSFLFYLLRASLILDYYCFA